MERLTKILTKSKIFDYFRMEGNVHNELQKAVYKITINSLLSKLTDKHKKLLLHEHYYQPDPNEYTPGKNLPLLEGLINDACFFSMSNPSFPLATTFGVGGNIKLFTGLKSEEILERYVHEINAIWEKEKIAKIGYKDKSLKFEIILSQKPNNPKSIPLK